jgi:hypothetical protein
LIRPCTASDIPFLQEIGPKFAARASLPFPLDPDSLERTLITIIETGVCLRGEHGAIGGFIFPHPFNNDVIVGSELFWWSEGREGLALLAAFEAACKDRDAVMVGMITLDSVEPERTGALLERRGFKPLERQYIKEI